MILVAAQFKKFSIIAPPVSPPVDIFWAVAGSFNGNTYGALRRGIAVNERKLG